MKQNALFHKRKEHLSMERYICIVPVGKYMHCLGTHVLTRSNIVEVTRRKVGYTILTQKNQPLVPIKLGTGRDEIQIESH